METATIFCFCGVVEDTKQDSKIQAETILIIAIVSLSCPFNTKQQ